jgi:hypothetical protein
MSVMVMVMVMVTVFWGIALCSLGDTDRSFGCAYYLHHQGDSIKRKKQVRYTRTGRSSPYEGRQVTHSEDHRIQMKSEQMKGK